MPSPWIQLLCVYTIYNVTEMYSLPFPFPVSLLLCSGSAPTLRTVHLLCMPLAWWLIVWRQSCASRSPALLGSVPWCFSAVCGSWHMTLQTLFPYTHTSSPLWWSPVLPASFYAERLIYTFTCWGGGLTTLGSALSSAFQLLRTPLMFPIAFPGVSIGGGLLRPLNPNKLSSP